MQLLAMQDQQRVQGFACMHVTTCIVVAVTKHFEQAHYGIPTFQTFAIFGIQGQQPSREHAWPVRPSSGQAEQTHAEQRFPGESVTHWVHLFPLSLPIQRVGHQGPQPKPSTHPHEYALHLQIGYHWPEGEDATEDVLVPPFLSWRDGPCAFRASRLIPRSKSPVIKPFSMCWTPERIGSWSL